MYSYEIVFSYPDLREGSIEEQVKRNALKYAQSSEFIVAEADEVIEYVKERMKIPNYEFVAAIRRNPIIKIIQKDRAEEAGGTSANKPLTGSLTKDK